MASHNAPVPELRRVKQPHKDVHKRYDSKVNVRGMMDSLNYFREVGILTDTTLKSTDRTFTCHKVVLSSASEYFKTMLTSEFKEAHSREVELPSIDPEILETVLDYIYGQEVILQADDVLRLHEASHVMQVNDLTEITKAFILSNFKECYEHPSFLYIPLPHLVEYISESHLEVRNDDDIYKAVMRWIKHDVPNRKHFTADLMAHVRLPYCTKSFFCEVILKEALINKYYQDDLRQAITFHLVPSSVSTRKAEYIKPRQGSLTIGFEEKSVLKYIKYSLDDGSILSVSEYKNPKYSIEKIADLPYSNCTSSYDVCASNTTVIVSGNRNCSHSPCENRCWSLNTLNGTWLCNSKQASISQQTYLIFDGTIYTSWSCELFMLRPHDDDWQTIDSNVPMFHTTLVDGNSKYLLSQNYLFDRFNNKWVTLKKPTQQWCLFRFIDDKLLAFYKGKHQFEYCWYNFTEQTWTSAGIVEAQCEGVNQKSKVCRWRGNLVFTYPDGLALFNPNTGILRHFISLKMSDYTKCNIFPIFVPD